jgi:hypothetical protein
VSDVPSSNDRAASTSAQATRAAWQRHLRAPGTPAALPDIRQAIVEAAEECGFDMEDVIKLEMAVGEACTNIIEHAYATQPLKLELEVRILRYTNRMEVVFRIIRASTSRSAKTRRLAKSTNGSRPDANAVWEFSSSNRSSTKSITVSSAARATNSNSRNSSLNCFVDESGLIPGIGPFLFRRRKICKLPRDETFRLLPYEHAGAEFNPRAHAETRLEIGGKTRNFVLKNARRRGVFQRAVARPNFRDSEIFDEKFSDRSNRFDFGVATRSSSRKLGAFVAKRDLLQQIAGSRSVS